MQGNRPPMRYAAQQWPATFNSVDHNRVYAHRDGQHDGLTSQIVNSTQVRPTKTAYVRNFQCSGAKLENPITKNVAALWIANDEALLLQGFQRPENHILCHSEIEAQLGDTQALLSARGKTRQYTKHPRGGL